MNALKQKFCKKPLQKSGKDIEQAQNQATKWLWTYNNERPHSAIGGVPSRYKLEKV